MPSAKLSFHCHCIPASEAQQVFAVLDTHRLLTVPLYLRQNCNMPYKILDYKTQNTMHNNVFNQHVSVLPELILGYLLSSPVTNFDVTISFSVSSFVNVSLFSTYGETISILKMFSLFNRDCLNILLSRVYDLNIVDCYCLPNVLSTGTSKNKMMRN